ncbi:hypothetical protein V5738_06825 [Salinisphaera sp. SPP-AMP-43]|uniref:hypothetical protein n=1 Tax=Salinisphaera sp. SPP-AMP-43 TaxID=3121288 RepID=UPI003C6E9DF3
MAQKPEITAEDSDTLKRISSESAKFYYIQFLLEFPTINVLGLYQDGNSNYIVCENIELDEAPKGYDSLKSWFNHAFKPVGWHLNLVTDVPPGAKRVNETNLGSVDIETGRSLTSLDYQSVLAARLPGDFPTFSADYRFDPRRLVITVEREISDDERRCLEDAQNAIGYLGPIKVVVAKPRPQRTVPANRFPVLRPVSLLRSDGAPRSVSRSAERDQDLWSDQQKRLWRPERSLNTIELKCGTRCLIRGDIPSSRNLRWYILLYDGIDYIFPPTGAFERSLRSLEVTEAEFSQLVECGFIRIILPQSVERYDQKRLGSLFDISEHEPILTRRLALAAVQQSRARFPLLYSPLPIAEKRGILKVLEQVGGDVEDRHIRNVIKATSQSLAKIWQFEQFRLAQSGAVGISTGIGFGRLASDIVRAAVNKERELEIDISGQMIEWAGALGAFPAPLPLSATHDNSFYMELICNFYNPSFPAHQFSRLSDFELEPAITGLLRLDPKADIISLARGQTSSESSRVRELLSRLPSAVADKDQFEHAIDDLNKQIKIYNRRSAKLAKFGFTGNRIATAVTMVDPTVATAAQSFFASWLFDIVKNHRKDSVLIGELLDSLEGLLAAVELDAVFVARMREDLRQSVTG